MWMEAAYSGHKLSSSCSLLQLHPRNCRKQCWPKAFDVWQVLPDSIIPTAYPHPTHSLPLRAKRPRPIPALHPYPAPLA